MDRPDVSRLDLVAAFDARPTGPHKPEVQQLLKLLRWGELASKTVAVQPRRGGRWYLARLPNGERRSIDVDAGVGFVSFDDAQRALFERRWMEAGGQVLNLLAGREVQDASNALDAVPPDRPLLGYTDHFSVAAGEPLQVKVSSDRPGQYRAALLRIRCGDTQGIGFKTRHVPSGFEGNYAARKQPVSLGSYVEVPSHLDFAVHSLTMVAHIWPTLPASGQRQAIMGGWQDDSRVGYLLEIGEDGHLQLRLGNGRQVRVLRATKPLLARHWYRIAAGYDPRSGEMWLIQQPTLQYAALADTGCLEAQLASMPVLPAEPIFRLAACHAATGPTCHYNGKLEAPVLLRRSLAAEERARLPQDGTTGFEADVVAAWDFSRAISSTRVVDRSAAGHHGHTVNLPARAMKGVLWDGSEFNWTHRPEHYGAIHFHEDDLYDCRWETDFTFQVPEDLPSGLYCVHLAQDGFEDYVPFVVRPPRGTARAPLALLLPTASYWAYANTHHTLEWREAENVRGVFSTAEGINLFLHEHREYGLSLYDHHRDGSGVCYSSRLRPILNMRPNERLWQLPADTHIIDWLEEKRFDFDVITEDDLEEEGIELLGRYRCVMTGTHPEYPSLRMMQAFRQYQEHGGRFMYMGGNGFYWRTAYHPDLPGVVEVRRAEDGIRSWEAEGGEYHHSFTGELGGMWRRMGAPPQSVAGVGMTAQGFDRSTHYERAEGSHDPRAAFIFEGVGRDERIGDFGLIGGGAAGWEVDRADRRLGTPPHALVLATASLFSSAYHWMKEEMTHTHSANTGDTCPFVRSDLVFYETPNGGAVFATGSIAWSGALSHNGYVNNVSRITENVLRRFLKSKPL